jgi:hypothetical protein
MEPQQFIEEELKKLINRGGIIMDRKEMSQMAIHSNP